MILGEIGHCRADRPHVFSPSMMAWTRKDTEIIVIHRIGLQNTCHFSVTEESKYTVMYQQMNTARMPMTQNCTGIWLSIQLDTVLCLHTSTQSIGIIYKNYNCGCWSPISNSEYFVLFLFLLSCHYRRRHGHHYINRSAMVHVSSYSFQGNQIHNNFHQANYHNHQSKCKKMLLIYTSMCHHHSCLFDRLAPGRCKFKSVLFEHTSIWIKFAPT